MFLYLMVDIFVLMIIHVKVELVPHFIKCLIFLSTTNWLRYKVNGSSMHNGDCLIVFISSIREEGKDELDFTLGMDDLV